MKRVSVNSINTPEGIDFYALCRMNFKQLKTTLKGLSYEELYNLFYFVKDVYIKQNDMLKNYGSVDKNMEKSFKEEAKSIYNQYEHVDKETYKHLVNSYVRNKNNSILQH